MKQEDKIRKYRLGLAKIPLLLVLLLLAIAVPVATKLVQQRQETRRGATGESYTCQRHLCGLRACIGVCSPSDIFPSNQNLTGCLDTGDNSSTKTICTVVVVPPPCGGIGQNCCGGIGGTCNAGDCVDGTCRCRRSGICNSGADCCSSFVCSDHNCMPVDPTAVPPTAVPPTGVPPTGVPPTAVPPTGVPLTGGATPTCNTSAVTLSVAPGTVAANSPVTFNISGSASTYLGDNYGGGASGCSGPWNSKACTSSGTGGTYTWTHTWKNCVGDINNCSGICTKSVDYVVSAPITRYNKGTCNTVAGDYNCTAVTTGGEFATLAGCQGASGCDVPAPAKTCSISMTETLIELPEGEIAVTLTGRGNSVEGELVRLSLENLEGTTLAVTPTGTTLTGPYNRNGRDFYYYSLGSCTSTNGSTCNANFSVSNIPAGNYYLHCDLNSDPNRCSGNPFCNYEGKFGGDPCTGWVSCSTSDNYAFTVGSAVNKFSRGSCNKVTGRYTCTASATGYNTREECENGLSPNSTTDTCIIQYAPVAGSCNTTTGDWTCAPSATGTFDTDALCKVSSGCDVASSTNLVLKYRMAFAGLKPTAKCGVNWTTGLIVKSGTEQGTYTGIVPVKTTDVNSRGETVFETSQVLTGFTKKTAVAAFVKGMKHLQMKYGQNSQTGTYGKAGGELTLKTVDETGHTVYDFTGYPLLAGDVDQNGVINSVDFAMVKAKASTYKQVDEGGYLLEDLDGSCQVNTADITLLVKSLDEKQAELY